MVVESGTAAEIEPDGVIMFLLEVLIGEDR